MKTSNYILIALFSFIVGSILVLFIAAIGHENNPYGRGPNFEKKEYSLEDFSVMVVDPNLHIEFGPSENNSLSFYLTKDREVSEKPFRISNDTLFVYSVAGLERRHSLRVSGNKLSAVVVKNDSHVSINHFNSEALSVDVQQASFSIDNSDIRELNVSGDKAGIRMFSSKIESISARLKNESSFDIYRNANKLDIEKDETSRYSLYQ